MDREKFRLEKTLKSFNERFKNPQDFAIDFFDLVNCIFDCLEKEDTILIYKASQIMVDISDNILISNKFSVLETERALILLNTFASYCARKSGKFYN